MRMANRRWMLYIMQLEFCKLSKPSKSWQIVNTASIIIMMDRTGYKFVKNGFGFSDVLWAIQYLNGSIWFDMDRYSILRYKHTCCIVLQSEISNLLLLGCSLLFLTGLSTCSLVCEVKLAICTQSILSSLWHCCSKILVLTDHVGCLGGCSWFCARMTSFTCFIRVAYLL